MSTVRWVLVLVVAACSPRAAVTPPAAPRATAHAPKGHAPSAEPTTAAVDRFRPFRREMPVPAPLEHGAFSLTDWLGDAQPSPIATRGELPVGQPNYAAWADLINRIHARVHPLFANQYIASLNELPRDSALNDPTLYAELELHIAQNTGELVMIGLRRSSGQPELDIAALAAFSQAFPLPIPENIASADGIVYLSWEAHRDETSCSSISARPHRLK